MKNPYKLLPVLVLLAFLGFAATDAKAQFPTQLFTVNSVNDSLDASPGDDICADQQGQCTLRAAIQEANSGYPRRAAVINFALPDPSVIDLTMGELVISSSLYIAGPGARRLTVQRSYASGTPNFRVFHLTPNVTPTYICGIKIQNGSVDDDIGGGVLTEGVSSYVVLNEVWIAGNHALAGGGVANSGGMMITSSLISSNTADVTSSMGKGGGIINLSSLQMFNSTVTGNRANSAGAIEYSQQGGLNLANDTIAGNFAETECTSICARGPDNGNLRIINTIIGPDTEAPQRNALSGAFYSFGHNIVTDARGSTGFANGVRGDQVSDSNAIDPMLGELTNNGGQTDTRSLLVGSPAIQMADNCVYDNGGACYFVSFDLMLKSDQRNRHSRMVNNMVDIGALQHDAGEIDEIRDILGWRINTGSPGPWSGSVAVLIDPVTNDRYYSPVSPFGYVNFTGVHNRVYIFEIRSKFLGIGLPGGSGRFPGVWNFEGYLLPSVAPEIIVEGKSDPGKSK